CRNGCVARAVLRQDADAASRAVAELVDIFGREHTWIEVQVAGLRDDARLVHGLARLARQADLGLVGTGNAHYVAPEDRRLQDGLVCFRRRLPLAGARPYLRQGASWHLRSPEEMARRFAELPDALRSARELADRCGFAPAHIDPRLPAFPVPAGH